MSAFYREKVLSVQHWTDTLFSFRATRDSGFRFQNGQFAMIGLEVEGRPLLRAYSMASANHEEELEFFSIKVQDGPLTSRLQKIKEGDTILVGRKATGTLITDNLIPGKRLMLLSTGTGLAPFASLIKDPEVYDQFDSIVLVHGCRQVSELAYGEKLVASLREDELFGELLADKLIYYPTVTREPFKNRGRITDLISSEQIFNDIGQGPLDRRARGDRPVRAGPPGQQVRVVLDVQAQHPAGDGGGQQVQRVRGVAGEHHDVRRARPDELADALPRPLQQRGADLREVARTPVHAREQRQDVGDVRRDRLQGGGAGREVEVGVLGRAAGDQRHPCAGPDRTRQGRDGAIEGERHRRVLSRTGTRSRVRACRRDCHDGQVVTRSTPPRRRVADQRAGAWRWHS